MSQYTTRPGDEIDLHKIESAVKLYYGYTGAYTRHLLKEWHAEELRQAKEQAWDQGAKDAAMSLDHGGHNADNPYRSQP